MSALWLPWGVAALFLFLVMAAAWIVQRETGQGGWADAFWSFGVGIAGAGAALVPVHAQETPSSRQILVAVLIGLWGLRLGLHITQRAQGEGEDPRYASLRAEWGAAFQPRMFVFLMLQAAAGALLVLGVLLAARNPLPGLRLTDLLATLVLVAAVAGEGLADLQLKTFKADPANRGAVCDRGLWSWSRHPNYFFEWLGWCAWPIFAIDRSGGWPWGWLALTAPAYMYWLLTRVSGIPPLEAHMRRSRPEAFEAYAARTNAFFPRPPRRAIDYRFRGRNGSKAD